MENNYMVINKIIIVVVNVIIVRRSSSIVGGIDGIDGNGGAATAAAWSWGRTGRGRCNTESTTPAAAAEIGDAADWNAAAAGICATIVTNTMHYKWINNMYRVINLSLRLNLIFKVNF